MIIAQELGSNGFMEQSPTAIPGGSDRTTQGNAAGVSSSFQGGSEVEEEEGRPGHDDLPAYLFRGDEYYAGGSVGIPLDSSQSPVADIQTPADHVLRKRAGKSSIFTSFTKKMDVAERFAGERKLIMKVAVAILRQLESEGSIRLWAPDDARQWLREAGKKSAKHASATRDAMRRNAEILVEGQIPAEVIQQAR
jgi:hypothetical protein